MELIFCFHYLPWQKFSFPCRISEIPYPPWMDFVEKQPPGILCALITSYLCRKSSLVRVLCRALIFPNSHSVHWSSLQDLGSINAGLSPQTVPWARGLPSLPATSGLQRAIFPLGHRLLCSGPKVLPHCGLFFVFLSCPLCSQMPSISTSWYLCTELPPEWTSDVLLLPHSRDSESPFSMGKGMMYSLPVSFLYPSFSLLWIRAWRTKYNL